MKATVTHIAQTFPTELPALVTNSDGEIVMAIPSLTFSAPPPPGTFYYVGLGGGIAGDVRTGNKADYMPFNGSVTLSN